MTSTAAVTFRPVAMRAVEKDDGTILLRSDDIPAAFDPNITRQFLKTAAANGEKTMYARRRLASDGTRGDWDRMSFDEVRGHVLGFAQWLLERDQADDRILVLASNSPANAVVRLGAIAAGVPACPVSISYAMFGGRYERLKSIVAMIRPTILFVERVADVRPALEALDLAGVTVLTATADAPDTPTVALDAVWNTPPTAALDYRIAVANPDTPIVHQLTSGSTGDPKAVLVTRRMIAANIHAANYVVNGSAGWDDLMLDWLPWSHVAGAFSLYAAAFLGGSLYIDDGKPMPGLFAETLRNLAELSPPFYSNVPIGYQLLVGAMEQDEALRQAYFKNMRLMLYGGAALPEPIGACLRSMARETVGREVMLTSGYGSTETAGGCMTISFPTEQVGIGLPLPGVDVKLIPCRDAYEIRVRGECVTTGYLDDPAASERAFDSDGFFKMGDVVQFHDRTCIDPGIKYVGRVAEEFKLSSGTWIRSGAVRADLLADLAPLLVDLIICGEGKDALGVLAVPNIPAIRGMLGEPDLPLPDLARHPKLIETLVTKLNAYNQAHPGSSERIVRFAVVQAPPDPDSGELTDKGTFNQAAARARRSGEVEALFQTPAPMHVLAFD